MRGARIPASSAARFIHAIPRRSRASLGSRAGAPESTRRPRVRILDRRGVFRILSVARVRQVRIDSEGAIPPAPLTHPVQLVAAAEGRAYHRQREPGNGVVMWLTLPAGAVDCLGRWPRRLLVVFFTLTSRMQCFLYVNPRSPACSARPGPPVAARGHSQFSGITGTPRRFQRGTSRCLSITITTPYQ